ncbi:zf-HC2 domain-containing protein [Oscillibacter sp.]|uniref:anti-sigma factor family protein n=1 Tax=Oscillibacter sp. TaxID=1945593 RepID=UPI00289B5018|nr:zf-HC2 domain-containing protein [Oscillibacter sp.]
MKICEQYAPLLDSFVDGELSEQEAGTVREHLAACPACAAYVSDAFAIRAAFGDVEETEVPAGFADGVMAVIRANAAPRKKTHRGLKTVASLAACAALVIAAVRVLPFENFSGSAPMTAMAGGGAAFKAESESSAAESEELLPTQEENESYDAPSDEDTMTRSYTASSPQLSEMYDSPSPDSAAPSEQQAPPSFLMTHQTNGDGGASEEDTVFAGVVFLPAGERLSALLEDRESQPYSDEDGGAGTGYAMTLDELTAILEELDVEPELRINTDKTTDLYCLVVSDS